MQACTDDGGPNNRKCVQCGRTFHSSAAFRKVVPPDSPHNLCRRCFYGMVARKGRIATILHEPRVHDWNLPPDFDFPSMFRPEFN